MYKVRMKVLTDVLSVTVHSWISDRLKHSVVCVQFSVAAAAEIPHMLDYQLFITVYKCLHAHFLIYISHIYIKYTNP